MIESIEATRRGSPSQAEIDLFQQHALAIYRRTDRMFAALMVLQWVAAIVAVCWVSPRTWDGLHSAPHPHVMMAIFGGGLLASLPVAMAIRMPGRALTRYVIASSQVLFSSLLIHVTGGRIETHFHIFVSLAFLAAYRDWKVLVPATLIIIVDHGVRGIWWPESVFGIATASHWRWLEHAAWVLFEDLVLAFTIQQSVREMRALALHTVQLEQARQVAEEASNIKGQFLASMSHELRTPLNGVIGMTELLADSPLSERQRRFVNACQSSGTLLLRLINDILDFSKIESGHLELDSHVFELQQLLEDVMAGMPLRLCKKNVHLACYQDELTPLYLLGDSHRLRQVLVNLLGNALKFTEEGEITLRVARQQASGDRVTLRMSIEDTGIGIPADRLDRLFQSFSQVDGSIRRKYGGSGLGLSISKAIVDALGGEIGVESRAGIGSRFWFAVTFPVASETEASELERSATPWCDVDDAPISQELPVLAVPFVQIATESVSSVPSSSSF
ncbi:Signal transduction histidine-protein kinase BarA [Rosistilla carotiformis]|uniref:histidine kinase n=1 Tax=Rosistilla carotiformis TaxID=2528017 RepID=A0A518K0H0_9BACT|nr:ATP-binding protein [Rosistilla carotiformis]QDV71245.1 Signal transduction histidine-protein kinase BarA [Rosistilla carotiformis]